MMKRYRRRLAPVPTKIAHPIDEEALAATAAQYKASKWTRRVLRPLLITLVVTALISSMLILVITITADTRWYRLIPFIFFIALESIYTTFWLNHPQRLIIDRNIYRAAELLLIVVLTRIVSWIIFEEGLPTQETLLLFLRNPLALIQQSSFLVSLVLIFITWRIAIHVGNIFAQLSLSEYEIRFYSLPQALRKTRINDQPIAVSRIFLTELFLKWWLWGGMVLIICAAISTIEISSIAPGDMLPTIRHLGLPPLLLASLLIYFLVGFWLLSEARLAAMNARWLINGITKNPGVEQSWHRYSLLILLGIALLATFLPIGSTLPIARIVELVILAGLFLVQMLVFAFVLIISLIMSLFPGREGEVVPPPPPPNFNEMVQESTQAAEPLSDTTAFVFSSAFWSIFVVVVVLALLFFMRERGYRFNRETAQSTWRGLKFWLAQLWDRLRNRMQDMNLNWQLRRVAVDEKEDTAVASKKRRWRFIRVNGLSPRDQIRYFYLSTVRRAGDKGVKRPSSRTPIEYADDLSDNWPATTDEIEDLTSAFLKARYSPHPLEKEDVKPVKKTWQQVKRDLRKPSKPDSDLEEAENRES